MFTFTNVEYYEHPNPIFPDAIYVRDDKGRDFYETRDALPDGCHVITVRLDGWVCGLTRDIKEQPTSIMDKVHLYQVDPATIPETIEEWNWWYTPEKGFHKP